MNYQVSFTERDQIKVNNEASRCVFFFELLLSYKSDGEGLCFIIYQIWSYEQLSKHLEHVRFYSTCKIKANAWALSLCVWMRDQQTNFLIPDDGERGG